jgi:hypothetical protein
MVPNGRATWIKDKNMKNLVVVSVLLLTAACGAKLDPEADRAAHNTYLESVYNLDNYDPEYVDDCLFYKEVVCEFE